MKGPTFVPLFSTFHFSTSRDKKKMEDSNNQESPTKKLKLDEQSDLELAGPDKEDDDTNEESCSEEEDPFSTTKLQSSEKSESPSKLSPVFLFDTRVKIKDDDVEMDEAKYCDEKEDINQRGEPVKSDHDKKEIADKSPDEEKLSPLNDCKVNICKSDISSFISEDDKKTVSTDETLEDILCLDVDEEKEVKDDEKLEDILCLDISDDEGSEDDLDRRGGVCQESAVLDSRLMSHISWQEAVENNVDVSFRAERVIIYDKQRNMLTSAEVDTLDTLSDVKLFLSAEISNTEDGQFSLKVEDVAFSLWRRNDSGDLIVVSNCKGKAVEYKISSFHPKYNKKLTDSSKKKNPGLPLEDDSDDEIEIIDFYDKESVDENLSKVLVGFSSNGTKGASPKKSKSRRIVTSDKKTASNSMNRSLDFGGSDELENVLKSFGQEFGCGDRLKKLLPKQFQACSDAVAAVLFFTHERQTIWRRKYRGKSHLTDNMLMKGKWFTNMYRELDRGTQYFRRCMLETTLKNHIITEKVNTKVIRKVLFKSIVYRLINEIKTFRDYGGIPSEEEFEDFEVFIKARHESKSEKVFTAAHQNNGMRRFLESISYVQENIQSLAKQLAVHAEERKASSCYQTIVSVPGIARFFGWQILSDLIEAKILGRITDNQWTFLGPGAENGLRRVFPLPSTMHQLKYTRLVRDMCAPSGPKSGFQALGLEFPTLLNKALSLKNVEHLLCEYDKYFRAAQGTQIKEREYNEDKSNAFMDRDGECVVCSRVGDVERRLKCVLCGSMVHKHCDSNYSARVFQDKSYVCQGCCHVEKAWDNEEFSYEEYDEKDETGKAWTSGEKKKAMRLKRKGKEVAKKKHKNIEVVDLSSDEEFDSDDDDDDQDGDVVVYSDESDNDECSGSTNDDIPKVTLSYQTFMSALNKVRRNNEILKTPTKSPKLSTSSGSSRSSSEKISSDDCEDVIFLD